jgi:hypothetical protein
VVGLDWQVRAEVIKGQHVVESTALELVHGRTPAKLQLGFPGSSMKSQLHLEQHLGCMESQWHLELHLGTRARQAH